VIVAVGSAQEPAVVAGCTAKRRLLGSSDGLFMSQAGSGRHWLLAAAGVDAPGDAGGAVSAFERELPDEYLREGVQKQLAGPGKLPVQALV
jgi:hypothetical protein